MLVKNPPVEITDNLLMLGTNEYPLFLFRGQREGAIFEGGTGAMGPLVGQQMERLGIDRDFVKQVVITHAHPDHVMAVPLFREMFPGVVVLASESAAKTLSAEKALAFFCKVDDALTNSLTKAGLITDEHRPKPLAEKRITVDRVVKEADTITIDTEGSFAVLETPGHSECSLSFHDAARGILIISDATGYYVPEDDWWWPNYFTDYGTYLSSMESLADRGAEILCLSHNGAIKGAEDVASYFSGAISATEDYHRRIIAEAGAGKAARQIAEELGADVYQKTQLLPLEFFQKNCGLLVKQSLRHEGISVDK
jgi:glyoxylase-like metal-dependent hydrolase (beta-lactamase superfamily II)